MSGTLTHLSAKGAQDSYLSHAPSMTYFKGTYKRHTNFSCEPIAQPTNQDVNFGKQITATISRSGDAVSKIWFRFDLPPLVAGWRYVDDVGFAVIDYIELEIGGHRFDRHTGKFLSIWNQLTEKPGKELDSTIGRGAAAQIYDWCHPQDAFFAVAQAGSLTMTASQVDTAAHKYLVPLHFFFNHSLENVLPLIALQFHEVKLNLRINAVQNCLRDLPNEPGSVAYTAAAVASIAAAVETGEAVAMTNGDFLVEYIFFDGVERRMLAGQQHEYLITQTQFVGKESVTSTTHTAKLNFNHPCTELIWVFQNTDFDDQADLTLNNPMDFSAQQHYDTAGSTVTAANYNWYLPEHFNTVKLQVNGHDRFRELPAKFFREVIPAICHTRIPRSSPVYVWNAALNCEQWRPSGSINFSRIDNVQLVFANVQVASTNTSTTLELYVFARNFNVMKVVSGMAGLRYAN